VFPQGWVIINGTVTDSLNGSPVPGHPVTILSDSTQGFLYYNVVYTDSTGYYYDNVPAMNDSTGTLYIRTEDCNGSLHQAVVFYNPVNNTFTVDFQICTSNVICQALFSYLAEPEGSPNYQFFDQSEGNIIWWSWSFGDGTFSQEQNPFHSFPEPGIYNTCLTVTGQNCTSSYCQEISISDTVYYQVYGQVFAGNFPQSGGEVKIFAMQPNGSFLPLNEGCPLDSNGIYFFTLVPSGNYFIQAVPPDNSGYLPTYFGDHTTWQNAAQIMLTEADNPYNINLAAAATGPGIYGPGSLSGQITSFGFQWSYADMANIFLLDENLLTIGFSRVNDAGNFGFPSLEYGVYNLRAELAGVGSDIMKFEITPEQPHLDVNLNYTGNSVLGTDEDMFSEELLSIYPNPVDELLFISYKSSVDQNIIIEIVAITGRLFFREKNLVKAGENVLSVSLGDYSEGIYLIRVITQDGSNTTKKVVKKDKF